jgi:hypothetical protein
LLPSKKDECVGLNGHLHIKFVFLSISVTLRDNRKEGEEEVQKALTREL